MFTAYGIIQNVQNTTLVTVGSLIVLPSAWASRGCWNLLISRTTPKPIIYSLLITTTVLVYISTKQIACVCDITQLKVGFSSSANYVLPTVAEISLDTTSLPFFLVTLTIGLVSIFFTHFYMNNEVYQTRFVQLLVAFLLSMLLLISANNIITVFLGWELIGLFSFLLINFWVLKTTSGKAALKALVYNQISDLCLMLAIVCYGYSRITTNSTNYAWESLDVTDCLGTAALTTAVCCKSAQFPMHFWLPDSMEAPIPASALIHSATLVSAGVYLVIRLGHYHAYSSVITTPLILLGSITVVVGGVSACLQNDLKKILAYSTISNCGFMVLFAALNKTALCFVYFALHGILKASAFFIIGTLVILIDHKQDWRYLGWGQNKKNKLAYVLVPVIALLGAWPGTVVGFVKHMNVDMLGGYLNTEVLQMCTAVGSATSVIYSIKIAVLWVQYRNIKKNTAMLCKNYIKQQINQVLISATIVLLWVQHSVSGLYCRLLEFFWDFSTYSNYCLDLLSATTPAVLAASYCIFSKTKQNRLVYLVAAYVVAGQINLLSL